MILHFINDIYSFSFCQVLIVDISKVVLKISLISFH